MKTTLILIVSAFALIALSLPYAFAETQYVSENFEITMRTGPSVERKIISLIPSGRALEVLSADNEWTQVRTSRGKEGWVLTRYLTNEEPCAMVFDRLKQEYDLLNTENKDLKKELNQLKTKGSGLESALSEIRQANEKLNQNYSTLKEESADFINLKAKHQKAVRELALEKEKSDRLEIQTDKMSRNKNIKWFLTGAGVLLLGIIIGLLSRSSRRRSRSSLLN